MSKQWFTRGEIQPNHVNQYYYVDRPTFDENVVQQIKKGNYILLEAHRQSGKTTRCTHILQKIEKDYVCLWISFQAGISFESVFEFWYTFTTRMISKYPIFFGDLSLPAEKSGSILENLIVNLFSKEAKFGKKVVIFLDEMDYILNNSSVMTSFLNVFRTLKQESAVQAIIGIGVFQILQVTNSSKSDPIAVPSPFNISTAINLEHFTLDETMQLFTEYTKDRQLELDDRIIPDIFDLTNGHPGLTCLCGSLMNERVAPGKNKIMWEDWMSFSRDPLIVIVRETASIQQIRDLLISSNSPIAIRARQYLTNNFMKHFNQRDYNGYQEEKYLLSIGVLIKKDEALMFSSVLIKMVILMDLAINFQSLLLPIPITDTKIDLVALVKNAVRYLSISELRDPLGFNRTTNAPSEAMYHFQLYSIIRWMLSLSNTSYRLLPEVAARQADGSFKYLDILISNGWKYAIELAANNTKSEIQEHVNRTRELYMQALKATEAIVVNFTTKTAHCSNFAMEDDSVIVVHVHVDLIESRLTLYTKNSEVISRPFAPKEEVIREKGSTTPTKLLASDLVVYGRPSQSNLIERFLSRSPRKHAPTSIGKVTESLNSMTISSSAKTITRITVKRFNKKGGKVMLLPHTLEELLDKGGKLLGIIAIKVRTEAGACFDDVSLIHPDETVCLTDANNEQNFDD